MKRWMPVILALAVAGAAFAAAQTGLEAWAKNNLLAALDDERQVEARYQAVLDRYGPNTMPFARIIEAERQHQALLLAVMERYGVTPPPNPYLPGTVKAPDTLAQAYAEAAQGERENYQMYQRLLMDTDAPDVRAVFTRLGDVSLNHHLPAFERWVNGAAAPGRAPGAGAGYGPGGGMGRGAGAGYGPGGGMGRGAGRGYGPGGGMGRGAGMGAGGAGMGRGLRNGVGCNYTGVCWTLPPAR